MLQPDSIKPFILDPRGFIRRAALDYFGRAFSQDADLMPLVLDAYDAYGEANGRYLLVQSRRFVQSEATIRRMLGLLASAARKSTKLHFNAIIQLACPTILESMQDEIASSPGIGEASVHRIQRRIELQHVSGAELWDHLQTLPDEYDADRHPHALYDHGVDIVQALATTGYLPPADAVTALKNSPRDSFMQTWLADLCGEMRLGEAVPTLVAMLRSDDAWTLDGGLHALVKIGGTDAIAMIKKRWHREEFDFRLYASGVLSHVHRPEAEAAIIDLLATEQDLSLSTDLSMALCEQFSRDGIPKVKALIDEGYDEQTTILEHDLLCACRVLGLDLPELAAWEASAQEDWEHMLAEHDAAHREGTPESAALDEFLDSDDDEDDEGGTDDNAEEQLEPVTEISRNAPCPCGSGKKYKRCCGKS